MCDNIRTLETNSDLVPRNHEYYVRRHTHRPWDGVGLLEITPEWVYGAYPSDEIIYTSNNYAVREELSHYSDGMGGNCAEHISTSRGMLCVPLWRDDDAGRAGGYHPAAIVGLSLLARMDDYPLLDEDDYSEREYGAWIEYLTDEFRWADDGEREEEDEDEDEEEIESHLTRFLAYCWENLVGYYSVYDTPADEIRSAYTSTREEGR